MWPLVVVASLLTAAQSAAEAPPPVPQGALVQLDLGDEPPPLPPLPDDDDDLSQPEPPPPPEGEGKAPAAPGALAEVPGMDPVARGALQVAAGCGTVAVLGLCYVIPWVSFVTGPLATCLAPALIALVETVVGDFVGQTRGALLWPILAAYGASVVGGLIIAGAAVGSVALFAGGFAALVTTLGQGLDPLAIIAVLLGSYAVLLGSLAAAIVVDVLLVVIAPVVAYALTSDRKAPGDSGFRFPGVITPSHEEIPPQEVKRALSGPRVAGAMAY